MDYYGQLDSVGKILARTEKCAACRNEVPRTVKQLKATRERMGADPTLLDAMQDVKDELARRHRIHPIDRTSGLGARPRTRKRFSKSLGRRSGKRR